MFVAMGTFSRSKKTQTVKKAQGTFCFWKSKPFYLVDLLPAVLIHAADLGVIVQQQLAAVGVSSNHGAVIEGSQASAVLVVR